MSRRRAYRAPVQEWAAPKTFTSLGPSKGLHVPDVVDKGQSNNSWPVPPGDKREKERPLPLPSDHDKYRDKVIGPTYYNKNDYVPTRTKSVPGDQYGHPTKYDYGMPTRRKFSTPGDAGSTPFIRKPADRQKNQKGVSKQRSKQDYLRNRARLKPERRKYWRKKKRDPDTKRQRKYYRMYEKRYTRKGKSPYMTPAERSKAWRKEQKTATPGGPTEGLMFTKKTEAPKGTTTTSMRAPNLQQHPQKGLWEDDKPNPNTTPNKSTPANRSNGFGKVLPPSHSDSQMVNNRVVPHASNTQHTSLRGRMG